MAAVETAAKTAVALKPRGPWQHAWQGLPDNPLATYYDLSLRRRSARRHFLLRYLPLILGAVLLITIAGGLLYDMQQGIAMQPREALLILIPVLLLGAAAYSLQGMSDALSDALAASGGRGPASKSARSELDELVYISRLNEHEILLGLLRVLFPRMYIATAVGCLTFALGYCFGVGILDGYTARYLYSLANIGAALICLLFMLVAAAPACLILLLYTIALGGGLNRALGFFAGRFVILLQLGWIPGAIALADALNWTFRYQTWRTYDVPNSLLALTLMGLLFIWLVLSQLRAGARAASLRPLFVFTGPWLCAAMLLGLLAALSLLYHVSSGFHSFVSCFSLNGFEFLGPWIVALSWGAGLCMPVNPQAVPSFEWLDSLRDGYGYYGGYPDRLVGYGYEGILFGQMLEDWLRLPLLLVLQFALLWICSRYALENIRRNRRAE